MANPFQPATAQYTPKPLPGGKVQQQFTPQPLGGGFNAVSGVSQTSTKPFVIAGLKAVQPGGVNTVQPNTLSPKQTAPGGQQKALGNSQTTIPVQSPASSGQPVFSPSGGAIIPQAGAVPLGNTPSPQTTPPQQQSPGQTTSPIPPTPAQPPTFPGMVQGLSNFNPFSNPSVSGAYQKAQEIQQQLEKNKEAEATAVATNRLNPVPIGDQAGREAIIQNQYLQQQTALSDQGAAQASLYQGGLAGTAQEQQAQSTAAGLVQPQLGGIGTQQYYSPLTGGAPQQSYQIKAGDTLYALAGGDQAKISAIEQANPGIDPNNLQPGQQINLPGQSGTPFTAGLVAGQQQAGQDLAHMQTALGQARGVASTLQNELKQNPQLNANSVAAANAITQWANGRVIPNSPYTRFLQDLQEYANTIAPVLGIGGTPTDMKTGIANSMIPILASGGTIVDAINNLDSLAVNKINEGSSAAQNLGSPSKASPISGGQQNSSTSGWASLGD